MAGCSDEYLSSVDRSRESILLLLCMQPREMSTPKCDTANTSALLKLALESETSRVPPIFLDQNVLERPPFELFHELVKFIAKERPSLGLLTECPCSSKQEKIIFIIKLLSFVSQVTGIRLDVYIAPQMLFYGQNSSAHTLLQALTAASMASAEVMSKALKFISNSGDAILLLGVKTRKSFTLLQALFRGWLVRKERLLVIAAAEAKIADAKHQQSLAEQEYEALLLRKSQLGEEILEAENKLKRILKLQAKSRTNIEGYPRQKQHLRPKTAPSMADTKLNLPMNAEFAASVIDMRAIQMRLKHKEKIFHQREEKMKAQRRASKHKEVGLKLQEERITELADKIRNQHLQLKEKKLQFERDKAMPTTQPKTAVCSVQTEEQKKFETRAIQEKLKQRVRSLNKREANILRMAKALKNRELELAKREESIASFGMDNFAQEVNSTSMKKQQVTLRNRRRSIDDDSTPDHEENEQYSSMQAIEEEEEETSAEDQVETPRHDETLASNDETIMSRVESVVPLAETTITKSATMPLSPHRPHQDQEDSTSQSLPQRMTVPSQHSQYSNHIFTFEKNNPHECDLGEHDDAQLKCALTNLRELL